MEHVDPDRAHCDFTAVKHVQRAGVAGRKHHLLVECLEFRECLLPAGLVLGVVGSLLHRLRVAAIGIHPADHEGHARHAALEPVVAKALGVLGHEGAQFVVGAGWVLDHVGVVGQRGLAFEHRHHITVHVDAQRVFGRLADRVFAGRDAVAVFEQQPALHHLAGFLLVGHDYVGVPGGQVGALLRLQFLHHFLRAGVVRAGTDHADLDARVLLLEQRPEVVGHVVDHVLRAAADDVERDLGVRGTGHGAQRQGD